MAASTAASSQHHQGAELMNKYGINVPKGVAVSSIDEAKNAVQTAFPDAKQLVVKSQILAGGRGLRTFKSGLKGGVHIVKMDQVEDFAGKMLGQNGRYLSLNKLVPREKL